MAENLSKEVKNLDLYGLKVASLRGKVELKLRSKDYPNQSVCLLLIGRKEEVVLLQKAEKLKAKFDSNEMI